jgi:DNA-binding beta-propeller fold protein YncE
LNRSTDAGHALSYGSCLGPSPCATDVTSYSEPLGIAVSPDGHSVYVATAATLEAQLHHFERAGDNSLTSHECWTDPTRTSGCGDGRQVHEIGSAQSVTATNTQVFVAGHKQSAVTAFTRDSSTGGLTPVGCVRSVNDFLHGCGQANEVVGLDDIRSVELSPDNTTLYVGVVYGINAFQGPLTSPPGGGPGGGGTGDAQW